jgi:hypothetical protein
LLKKKVKPVEREKEEAARHEESKINEEQQRRGSPKERAFDLDGYTLRTLDDLFLLKKNARVSESLQAEKGRRESQNGRPKEANAQGRAESKTKVGSTKCTCASSSGVILRKERKVMQTVKR